MVILIGLAELMLFSCSYEQSNKGKTKTDVQIESVILDESDFEKFSVVYWDSTSIGNSNSFKVRIEDYALGELNHHINLQLFKKEDTRWKKTQELEIEASNLMNMSPRFSDFNNDSWNDLTVISGTAMRGSNEITTLFIFDPENENFIHIKNSESHPNLAYNPKTKSVKCLHVTGGYLTEFLRIQHDSLVTFASVDDDDGIRTSVIYNSDGHSKVIHEEPSKEGIIAWFSNYDPIEE